MYRKDTLADLYDDQSYGLTPEFRKQKIRSNLFFAFFELIIVAIASALVLNYASDQINIIKDIDFELRKQIVPWTYVYGALYIIIFLRRLALIFMWCCMDDPREAQATSNFFTFVFLNTFEVAWFIYGNTIFWGQNGLYGP